MKSVYCKHCGTFLFGIENSCIYYAAKCKKCGKLNYGKSQQEYDPKKKNMPVISQKGGECYNKQS